MKKLLLFFATTLLAFNAAYAQWQKPLYNGPFQPLTAGDTVYIYNPESKMFLTEGNDWGTHATVGSTGIKFIVDEYAAEGAEWDGKTYVIQDYSAVKGGWHNMFITDGGGVYVDRGSQADYFFYFTDKGSNTYGITGADANPVWNNIGEMEGYVVGHFTGYINAHDGIETGTGVIYDYAGVDNNYQEGEFLTTWAFVSQTDYAAYEAVCIIYEKAQELAKSIADAEAMGMTNLADEKAVYANTNSTLADIEAALQNVETKKLAYYEQTITPDNPVVVVSDNCEDISAWTNNLNASTWNTQTWIGDGWEGFEGTTLNIWGATLNGTAMRSLSGMPNGVYVVSMAVFSEKMDAYAYANENTVAIAGGTAGKTYTITTNVTDGNLEYGCGMSTEGTNWIAIDNVTVKYYGKGLAAYKYWLNSLNESTPSFDDVIMQDALIAEYEEVLKSISAAETDEEILAAIPAYEAILNKMAMNTAAYEELKNAIEAAEALVNSPEINENYGTTLSDMVTNYSDIIETHKLGTEEVNAKTAEMTAANEEAQNYIWNMEKLIAEVEKANELYEEKKNECKAEAAEAYQDFIAEYEALNTATLTNDAVLKMMDDLYALEFNLNLKDEPASDENPIDYTAKIFNPTFVGVEGWTNEGWATFSNNTWYGFANEEGASSGDGNYLNLWNTSDAQGYQKIEGLPAGAYTVTLGAYADNEGLEIYANDEVISIPVGRNSQDQYMSNYNIDVIVGEDGVLNIGIRNTNGGTQWAMVDEVRLAYKGTESEICTGIKDITISTNADGIFSISGVKVTSMDKKGLYIVNGKKIYK